MKVRAIDPSQAQHRRFESGVVLGFMAAAVIAFSLVATTWKMAADSAQADQRVTHSREMLDAIAQIRMNTLSIEYSTQGFRFTGDLARLAERDVADAARKQAPAASAAPNFARLVKDSNNNVREALMRLETELLLA